VNRAEGSESLERLRRGTLFPIAAAIGIFGVVYGAAGQQVLGAVPTMISSLIIFSGTAQFTMVGLLAAGSGPFGILWAVLVINVRNFALGAAIRPHLHGTMRRRALTSWFLIDETVGLALASPSDSDQMLIRSGIWAYAAWTVGTVVGVAGGATFGLEELASTVFPVLFVGLASLMVRTARGLARVALGGVVTLVLLLAWPSLAGLAPVIGGVVAALPGGRDEQ
jgi:predicted branched-subunit amino acid permease